MTATRIALALCLLLMPAIALDCFSFSAGKEITDLSSPVGIDIGPDGNIIIANSGQLSLSVYASLDAEPTQIELAQPIDLEVYNNRIFISQGQAGVISIYTLSGVEQNEIADDNLPLGIAVGEFRPEMGPEILVSDFDKKVRVYSSTTGEALAELAGTFANPAGIAVGDFDGDKSNEIAVADSDAGTVFIYESIEDPSPKTIQGLDKPFGVDFGDLDNDKDLELIVSDQGTGKLLIYESFDSAPHEIPLEKAGSVAVGDVSEDWQGNEIVVTFPELNKAVVLKADHCGDGTKNCGEACEKDADCVPPANACDPATKTWLQYLPSTCSPTCASCTKNPAPTTRCDMTGSCPAGTELYCTNCEHCNDNVQNCKETGTDCGDDCLPCPGEEIPCSGAVRSSGPNSGKCDTGCGSAQQCHGVVPGTDPCTPTCQSATQSLDLKVGFRKCESFDITPCLSLPPANGTIDTKEGMPILLTYEIGVGSQPVNATVSLYAGGERVCAFKEMACQTDASGGNLLLTPKGGAYPLVLKASHPDYLDAEAGQDFSVELGLSNAVKLGSQPLLLNFRTGSLAQPKLLVENRVDRAFDFTITAPAYVQMEGDMHLSSYEKKTLIMDVAVPDQAGTYPFDIVLSSSEGNLTLSRQLKASANDIYSVHLEPRIDGDLLFVDMLNNGTLPDTYRISGCKTAVTKTVPAGESETVEIGRIEDECEVCAESDHIEKQCARIRKAAAETLLSLTIRLPASLEAQLGKPVSFPFSTTASSTGTIHVTPSSSWLSGFDCPATCDKQLTLMPAELGNTSISFTVVWEGRGIEATKTLDVHVGAGTDTTIDRTEINRKINLVEDMLALLEQRGIDVPEAKKALDLAKSSPPENPAEAAQLLGELQQAERYIDWARQTRIPALDLPYLNLGIGALAVLIGLFLLWRFLRQKPEYK